jgi:hypothetical protein
MELVFNGEKFNNGIETFDATILFSNKNTEI